MLVQHEVPCETTGTPRKVWVQPPISGEASACLVFLDGELYIDRVQSPEIVLALQESAQLPPVTCVYFSNGDAAARHRDFTCNETFASFVAVDLVRWIEQTMGNHGRHFLVGLSLSGLAAVFTALRHPGVFAGTLCQSPSAWWNDEWLAASLNPGTPHPGRFWISVGDAELAQDVSHPPTGLFQKTSQLESVRRLTEKLRGMGGVVRHAEFHGGHDPACWAQELPDALPWLLT